MKRIDELEKKLVKEALDRKVVVMARDPGTTGIYYMVEMPVSKLLVKARGGDVRGTKFSAPIRRDLEKQVLDHNALLTYAYA